VIENILEGISQLQQKFPRAGVDGIISINSFSKAKEFLYLINNISPIIFLLKVC